MALYLRQNFVSAQYLENQMVEVHQVLYMHLPWQNLAWDCYRSFSHMSTRVMALDLSQNFVSAQVAVEFLFPKMYYLIAIYQRIVEL